MKRDAVIQATLAAVLGASCHNPDAYSYYVIQNYGSVRGEMFEFDGEDFAVLDKPQENRMLVAHASNVYAMQEWTQVAAAFLDRGGRDCEIAEVNPVTLRQIEFRYFCG